MARFLKKRDAAAGLAPGSLVFVGTKKVETTSIHVMTYDRSTLRESDPDDVSNIRRAVKARAVNWINVYGVHESEIIKGIGDAFAIHPLVLEDIMNTGQRPKFEDFDDAVVLMVKMFRYDQQEEIVHAENMSLVLRRGILITFQERPGDVFTSVRERIRKKRGKIRGLGADYLAYALLDTIVDNYMSVIERLGGKIEDLDEDVLEEPTPDTLQKINDLRREVNYLRKSIRPAREAILQLSRSESQLLSRSIEPYLKDLLDLCTQATEAIDTYRDMLSDHLSNYNAAVSYRMNDIMRVLTIYAAIFIPLTFIAGVYGMNFDNLPELHFEYAYFVLWGLMVAMAGGMLIYFKRKGWL